MENFNKVLSFILGLVVVVILLVFVSRRVDLSTRFLPLSKGGTKVETPTKAPQKSERRLALEKLILGNKDKKTQTAVSPTPARSGAYQTKKISSIPKTGAPTLLIPLAFSSLLLGGRLRKSGKK